MQAEPPRPSIFETSYRYFDRPLHPELFNPAIVGRVKTDSYDVSIGIIRGGHYIQMTSDGRSIAEVTAPDDQQLSMFGKQQTHFFPEDQELLVETERPFQYHFAGQFDQVELSVYTRVHMELEQQSRRAFLTYQFPTSNRLLAGPLSLIQVEGNARMLSVHTFHTFPDDEAVLRTQSLFEFN